MTLAVGSAAVALAASGMAASAQTTTAQATSGTRVVHTTPSATVGGLPIKSLDGRTEYVPVSSGTSANAPDARQNFPSLGGNDPYTPGTTGYDISWPDCPAHIASLPPASDVAVVGVNDGTPFSTLPCLQEELDWSPSGAHSQYMVLDSPIGYSSAHVLEYAYHGPAGDCTATQYYCQAFNWGYNAALYSVSAADAAGATTAPTKTWWLDVELPDTGSIDPPGADCYQPNFWVCDTKVNSAVVVGAIAGLKTDGQNAGVYSTNEQWTSITGGIDLGLPIWIAGYDYPAATYCAAANADDYWFDGGKPWLVQSLPDTYDPDTAC